MDPIVERVIKETVHRTIEDKPASMNIIVAEVMDVLEHSELLRGQVLDKDAIRAVIDTELNRTGTLDEVMNEATIRREKAKHEKVN